MSKLLKIGGILLALSFTIMIIFAFSQLNFSNDYLLGKCFKYKDGHYSYKVTNVGKYSFKLSNDDIFSFSEKEKLIEIDCFED